MNFVPVVLVCALFLSPSTTLALGGGATDGGDGGGSADGFGDGGDPGFGGGTGGTGGSGGEERPGCCSGIEIFEKGFGGAGGDSGGSAGGIGGGGGDDSGYLIVRRLFGQYPATDEDVAMEMLDRFRSMEDDPLAYLTETPNICRDIGGCVGLEHQLVQSMARIAFNERRSFWNNFPAWGSLIIALLAFCLGIVTERRSRRNEKQIAILEQDRA